MDGERRGMDGAHAGWMERTAARGAGGKSHPLATCRAKFGARAGGKGAPAGQQSGKGTGGRGSGRVCGRRWAPRRCRREGWCQWFVPYVRSWLAGLSGRIFCSQGFGQGGGRGLSAGRRDWWRWSAALGHIWVFSLCRPVPLPRQISSP